MLPVIDQIRTVADALSTHERDLGPARALLGRLENELLPLKICAADLSAARKAYFEFDAQPAMMMP